MEELGSERARAHRTYDAASRTDVPTALRADLWSKRSACLTIGETSVRVDASSKAFWTFLESTCHDPCNSFVRAGRLKVRQDAAPCYFAEGEAGALYPAFARSGCFLLEGVVKGRKHSIADFGSSVGRQDERDASQILGSSMARQGVLRCAMSARTSRGLHELVAHR